MAENITFPQVCWGTVQSREEYWGSIELSLRETRYRIYLLQKKKSKSIHSQYDRFSFYLSYTSIYRKYHFTLIALIVDKLLYYFLLRKALFSLVLKYGILMIFYFFCFNCGISLLILVSFENY